MPTINLPKKKRQNHSINRQNRQKVYQTQKWKDIREAYLMEHPLCELCLTKGKTVMGEDVHHIISPFENPKMQDYYAYDSDNLITLCKECHGQLHATKAESTLHHIYYERKQY